MLSRKEKKIQFFYHNKWINRQLFSPKQPASFLKTERNTTLCSWSWGFAEKTIVVWPSRFENHSLDGGDVVGWGQQRKRREPGVVLRPRSCICCQRQQWGLMKVSNNTFYHIPRNRNIMNFGGGVTYTSVAGKEGWGWVEVGKLWRGREGRRWTNLATSPPNSKPNSNAVCHH